MKESEPKAPINEVVKGSKEGEVETIPNKIENIKEILRDAYKKNESGTLGDASEKVGDILEELKLEIDKLNKMLNEYEEVISGKKEQSKGG